jgi:hypothetical protein
MKNSVFKSLAAQVLLTAGLTVLNGVAANAHVVYLGAILPYPTIPALDVPASVVHHPGKEYSEEFDRDAAGALDSSQNVLFDGRLPSGVTNGDDYNDPAAAGPDGSTDPTLQVDAIANHGDAYYSEVISNATAILFSTRTGPNAQGSGFDAGAPGCGINPICYETVGGGVGTWATPLMVTHHAGAPAPEDPTGATTILQNLDGLEVFGPEGVGDSDRYSLFADFLTGVSIYNLDGTTFLSQSALATALVSFEPRFIDFLNLIDLDALMVKEDGDGEFGAGDSLLFSLWPILGAVGFADIGDAAYVMDGTTGAISFLSHGGHLWDNDWLGLNVDALEAAADTIPEPATMALLLGGLAGTGAMTRRRRV